MKNEKNGEFILYQSEDGETSVELTTFEGSAWLSQKQMAELFLKSRSNITEHIQNIFNDEELQEISVCRDFRHTATDGKNYSVKYYNLKMILAVGYRVRSPRGVQFRRWATTILEEYLVKGFAMDDERLKQTETWDYFDEWLARIRDIRASEKRFYQKIKDLFTTAIDYDKSAASRLFFKKIQNKMLWATTGKTAAEIIAERSDENASNMGLTSWKGSVVRKVDIGTSKNYLSENEIDELNRIVTMYLDYAEDQAKLRNAITMQQWLDKLDAFLTFNDRALLTHTGKMRMDVAKKLASEKYEMFDSRRKLEAANKEDEEDFQTLEELAKKSRGKK